MNEWEERIDDREDMLWDGYHENDDREERIGTDISEGVK